MSSALLIVAAKYRAPKKIRNVRTTILRTLAISCNNSIVKNDFSKNHINPMNIGINSNNRGNFCFSLGRSIANSSTRANVDSKNILKSPFEDVRNFTGTFMHDHVWRNLDRWPEKTALICSATGRSYTYSEARKAAGRLATSLRKMNLRPGDTIAAILPNIPEYGILILGTSEALLRLTLINPAYTVEEIRTQLKNSNASVVFTVPSKCPIVAASIIDNSSIKSPIVVIEDGSGTIPEGTIKFDDLVSENIDESVKTVETNEFNAEDTFLLPYSSGTSGLPKGVELSHRNIVASLLQSQAKGVKVATETTKDHQEIVPIILPMFHIYGLVTCLLQYLCIGGKLICMPQFTPENLFKVLDDNRSTLLYVVPPLIQLLANDPRLKSKHLETIKTVIAGAAPLGEEVIEKFRSRTSSKFQIIQGYGLTECSPVVSMSIDTPHISNGYLVPNTKVRIVGYEMENEGENLGANKVGEIYVKGPQVMKGYYKNPRATKDCLEDDWFKTGDLGCYDEKGLMYIRGRLKELIKVQGYQVAPAELEDIIQGHEKVADAAIIGVSHEKYGEVPKAFVVKKNGADLHPDEIKNWVSERVAKYKRLGQVEFIDKIPKSAAGKILKRELRKF